MKRQIKKTSIFIFLIFLTVALSSCSILKKFAPKGEEEEEKPAGYVETKENELFIYDVFRDHITITGYLAEDTVVNVPETIDEKTVTTIGSYAFYDNNIPTSIELPSTITTIEANGFYFCNQLTEIVLPDSVTFIGERAFAWCHALTKITLPTGITEIADYTFNDCPLLNNIVIPSNVTKIGLRAFSYCTSMTRIELPSSVTSVKENSFLGCTSLQYAIIPASVTDLAPGVFKNCTALTVVTPEGSAAFQYCIDNQIISTIERPADEVSEDESGDVSGTVSE